jgi:hypothetical protein
MEGGLNEHLGRHENATGPDTAFTVSADSATLGASKLDRMSAVGVFSASAEKPALTKKRLNQTSWRHAFRQNLIQHFPSFGQKPGQDRVETTIFLFRFLAKHSPRLP